MGSIIYTANNKGQNKSLVINNFKMLFFFEIRIICITIIVKDTLIKSSPNFISSFLLFFTHHLNENSLATKFCLVVGTVFFITVIYSLIIQCIRHKLLQVIYFPLFKSGLSMKETY